MYVCVCACVCTYIARSSFACFEFASSPCLPPHVPSYISATGNCFRRAGPIVGQLEAVAGWSLSVQTCGEGKKNLILFFNLMLFSNLILLFST